jgi:hypothetical protein
MIPRDSMMARVVEMVRPGIWKGHERIFTHPSNFPEGEGIIRSSGTERLTHPGN